MSRQDKSRSPRKTASTEARTLTVQQKQEDSAADALAHTAMRPEVQAGLTLLEVNKAFGEMSVNTLVNDLREQCEQTGKGDLRRVEAMLVAQAHTLDAIFHSLARRAQRVDYLKQLEANLRLAFKAQSQCRATVEALAAIKNPAPVAFVRQANIANGPQQVNNGGSKSARGRARETTSAPNKLMESQDGERLDVGTTCETSRVDSKLEALDPVNRT